MTNAGEFAHLTETMKQKVQAKTLRIRRYETGETQCIQNKMFKEDPPKIYRNLDTKSIEARKHPSVAEVESYWKSLWGEKAQDNESTDWIRREERRKISNMNWGPVQILEITSFF